MILKITLCLILLSAVSYLAISRKSTFKIRLAALAALAAMIITVIICVFKIFMTPGGSVKVQVLPDQPPPPPAPPPNPMALVLFIVILMSVFLVVLFLSIREQRRVASEDAGLSKLGL
jgi:multisubunit Na+/H+ antiporter MnhC subunit